MILDAMKQALEALELLARYENPATKIQVRKPRDGGSIVTMYPHKVASEAATALRVAIDQAQKPCVKTIKTWQQRCEKHPDHNGIVTERMIQARMQEEIDELRAAIEQAQGLAEKVPAKGTLLEQTLRRVWDEMPHTALMDAIIGGTGVMLGDKRIDPASIYKQPEQDPRRWEDQETCHCDSPTWCKHYNKCNRKMLGLPPAPRQWQGLTDEEIAEVISGQFAERNYWVKITKALEAKLKEKNT